MYQLQCDAVTPYLRKNCKFNRGCARKQRLELKYLSFSKSFIMELDAPKVA